MKRDVLGNQYVMMQLPRIMERASERERERELAFYRRCGPREAQNGSLFFERGRGGRWRQTFKEEFVPE